jgi:hypothetical protein
MGIFRADVRSSPESATSLCERQLRRSVPHRGRPPGLSVQATKAVPNYNLNLSWVPAAESDEKPRQFLGWDGTNRYADVL